MQWIKFVAVAMLIWGNSAFASRGPETGDPDIMKLQTQVWDLTVELNGADASLHLSTRADLGDPKQVKETLTELQTLKNILNHLDVPTQQQGLTVLSCNKPACWGQ